MEISKAHDFMVSALDNRAIRQKMISSNISNIDTPFYRPRDIAFEKVLSDEVAKTFDNENNNDELTLARSNYQHINSESDYPENSTMFFRDGHASRNDGNSVDLDVETTEMGKNSMMYKAVTSSLRKESNIFRAVIAASEKIS